MRFSPETNCAGIIILDILASITVRNTFLLFKLPFYGIFVRAAPNNRWMRSYNRKRSLDKTKEILNNNVSVFVH
jgi:hypothetical protein